MHELPADEKREILDAHPAIGQRAGLSARSAAEQGADADPDVLAELARLNAAYEERHGFRFVVFVNRRPKHEILEVLRVRIDNPTDEELETALGRARRDRGGPVAPGAGRAGVGLKSDTAATRCPTSVGHLLRRRRQ